MKRLPVTEKGLSFCRGNWILPSTAMLVSGTTAKAAGALGVWRWCAYWVVG
jgi:hypothetical protein